METEHCILYRVSLFDIQVLYLKFIGNRDFCTFKGDFVASHCVQIRFNHFLPDKLLVLMAELIVHVTW